MLLLAPRVALDPYSDGLRAVAGVDPDLALHRDSGVAHEATVPDVLVQPLTNQPGTVGDREPVGTDMV